MDKEITVSVVVPIYNVEKYLDRCVKSIINQTYQKLQIILVDDGSLDDCPEICDRWREKDNRIEVIHKKNSGLGMTRNAGLKQAVGKYVCFVDSDDYIHPTTIEKLLKKAAKYEADVCYYGCIDVLDGNESEKQPPKKTVYVGEEVRHEFAARLLGNAPSENTPLFSGMSACYAFYNTKFLKENHIEFHSEREKYISEDLIFNLSVCAIANTVTILPESLYYYVIRRRDSLRSTYRSDRFEKSKIMYEKLIQYSREFGLGDDGILRTQSYFIQTMIVCSKMELLAKKNVREVMKVLSSYVDDSTLREIIENYPIRQLSWKQKIFCYAVKFRCVKMIYCLSWLQNKKLKKFV